MIEFDGNHERPVSLNSFFKLMLSLRRAIGGRRSAPLEAAASVG
jgi:hypothetical protein